METKRYQVEINGEKRAYPEGTTYLEIAKEYQDQYDNDIVLVFVNEKLQELRKKVTKDCRLRFVTTGEELGNMAYRRGVSFLLIKAVYDAAGHENVKKVRIHYSVDKGFYFTLKGNLYLDQELLEVHGYQLPKMAVHL